MARFCALRLVVMAPPVKAVCNLLKVATELLGRWSTLARAKTIAPNQFKKFSLLEKEMDSMKKSTALQMLPFRHTTRLRPLKTIRVADQVQCTSIFVMTSLT